MITVIIIVYASNAVIMLHHVSKYAMLHPVIIPIALFVVLGYRMCLCCISPSIKDGIRMREAKTCLVKHQNVTTETMIYTVVAHHCSIQTYLSGPSMSMSMPTHVATHTRMRANTHTYTHILAVIIKATMEGKTFCR